MQRNDREQQAIQRRGVIADPTAKFYAERQEQFEAYARGEYDMSRWGDVAFESHDEPMGAWGSARSNEGFDPGEYPPDFWP